VGDFSFGGWEFGSVGAGQNTGKQKRQDENKACHGCGKFSLLSCV
jgi:hypothetical protein